MRRVSWTVAEVRLRRPVLVMIIVILGAIGAAFLLVRPASAQGIGCMALGRDLVIPAGESCPHDAVAILGDLVVQGRVCGNAVAIGGSVRIGGRVEGDVVALGGTVLLEGRARVGGNVSALTGMLRRAPGTVVGGSLLESGYTLPRWRPEEDRLSPSAWARLGVAALACGLALGVCLLLALFLRALWPRRTGVMVGALRHDLLTSVGMGVATTLLVAVSLPLLSLFMVLTLIGIALLPLLYLVSALLYLAGLTVAGLALGQSLVTLLKGRSPGHWLPSLVGIAVLVVSIVLLGVYAPLLGVGLALVLSSCGVGAIILSRVGTAGRPRSAGL